MCCSNKPRPSPAGETARVRRDHGEGAPGGVLCLVDHAGSAEVLYTYKSCLNTDKSRLLLQIRVFGTDIYFHFHYPVALSGSAGLPHLPTL